jgi:hypothetical protein
MLRHQVLWISRFMVSSPALLSTFVRETFKQSSFVFGPVVSRCTWVWDTQLLGINSLSRSLIFPRRCLEITRLTAKCGVTAERTMNSEGHVGAWIELQEKAESLPWDTWETCRFTRLCCRPQSKYRRFVRSGTQPPNSSGLSRCLSLFETDLPKSCLCGLLWNVVPWFCTFLIIKYLGNFVNDSKPI